jgi:hypothetical protein
LASYATSVYWLEVLLGGDREQQRRQWGADLASYSPPECYDEEMHDIVDSADEVRRRVLGVPIVKLDRVAAALKSLPPPAAASAASTAAPSTSRVAPSGSAAQRVPLP